MSETFFERPILNSSYEYQGEDAKKKANTMHPYWMPGVNNFGKFGRWAFAEFTAVYEIEKKFAELVEGFVAEKAA